MNLTEEQKDALAYACGFLEGYGFMEIGKILWGLIQQDKEKDDSNDAT